MTTCKFCKQADERQSEEVAPWRSMVESQHFDVTHAANSSLPGWTLIVTKRHVSAIEALTDSEAAELGVLIHRVSKALTHAVGCTKTYVMQFAEKVPHVHFHIVPRMPDLEEQSRGPNVFNYMDVDVGDSVPEDVRNEIALKMRGTLPR